MAPKKEKIIDLGELFDSSIEELNAELSESRKLYDELKTHYDQVKSYKPDNGPRDLNISFDSMASASQAPKSFAFIHQQTANLIGMRSHIAGLLKNKYDIQKEKATLLLKEHAIVSKTDGDEKEIVDNHINDIITEMQLRGLVTKNEQYDNDDADDMLASRLNDSNKSLDSVLVEHKPVVQSASARIAIILKDITIILTPSGRKIPVDDSGDEYVIIDDVETCQLAEQIPVKEIDGVMVRVDTGEELFISDDEL